MNGYQLKYMTYDLQCAFFGPILDLIWPNIEPKLTFQAIFTKFTPNTALWSTGMNKNAHLRLLTSNVLFWPNIGPDLAKYFSSHLYKIQTKFR